MVVIALYVSQAQMMRAASASLPTLVAANLFGVLNGGQAAVAFRFAPIGLGAKWRIDDVYVDPMARH